VATEGYSRKEGTGCGFESRRVHGGYSSAVERRIVAADTRVRSPVVTLIEKG
jgi:hypothetical protein